MALHTDIPTHREIERLINATADFCVSIYLPTHRVTPTDPTGPAAAA
ncbi:MAG: hypothetical protein M5U19_20510 [Microthrixaceae bacterium]|nr:hypothetical protein [Microthrixaceae bacterium]